MNRRFVWPVAAVLCALILSVGVYRRPRDLDKVRARSFVLVDDKGKTRAQHGMFARGPGLSLYHENGKRRAAVSVLKDRPLFSVFDDNGIPIWWTTSESRR